MAVDRNPMECPECLQAHPNIVAELARENHIRNRPEIADCQKWLLRLLCIVVSVEPLCSRTLITLPWCFTALLPTIVCVISKSRHRARGSTSRLVLRQQWRSPAARRTTNTLSSFYIGSSKEFVPGNGRSFLEFLPAMRVNSAAG